MKHELIPETTLLSSSISFRVFRSQLPIHLVIREVEKFFVTIATNNSMDVIHQENQYLLKGDEDIIRVVIQTAPPQTQSVLPFSSLPTHPTELLLWRLGSLFNEKVCIVVKEIEDKLAELENVLSDQEIDLIINSMPLLKSISTRKEDEHIFSNFALIWRDHFLEENIALLQSFEKMGIPTEWIYVLSKGDRTAKCERIAAYFRQRGYFTDILDSNYSSREIYEKEIHRITADLTQFIQTARRANKRVMAIDDGGLLFFCFRDQQKMLDFAIEVTIVGTKRLLQLPSIDIPIFDVGRSKLKEVITYPEIAESGVMRVKEMIPAEKLRGRNILVIGYGTAGKQVAQVFHSMGSKVSVVDNNILALIEAAERGYRTYRTPLSAIREMKPFLVFGCTGEISLSIPEFDALPDGAFVTAIATKDLSELRMNGLPYEISSLPKFGYEYKKKDGKRFYQLGDGRSFNLFLSEAIPNKANDVFKSGILEAAKALSHCYQELEGGIYVEKADLAIAESGLLERYYDMYLADPDERQ